MVARRQVVSDTTPQVDLPRRIRHLVGVTGKSSIPKGRFSQRLLGERIDAARETAGLSQVDLAERIGIDKGAYTRKVRTIETPLYISECEAFAEVLGMPDGWPFISEEDARRLKLLHEGRTRFEELK